MNARGSASLAATDIMDAIRVDSGGVLVVEKFGWKLSQSVSRTCL